jgi:hypothetical protein
MTTSGPSGPVFAANSQQSKDKGPSASELQALVFDYLLHSCYPTTARQFALDIRPSSTPELDADGDEIMASSPPNSQAEVEVTLRQVDRRDRIRFEIMSGRVENAISLIQEHFPGVLTQPTQRQQPQTDLQRPMTLSYVSCTSTQPNHVSLNLQTLAFIEAARTLPLTYPSVSSGNPSESVPIPHTSVEKQSDLLMKARKLHAAVKLLPDAASRAVYAEEMENVAGALAYLIPERSAISKYFGLERRRSVAEQVDRAILVSLGLPVISKLELVTRNVSLTCAYLNELRVSVSPSLRPPGLIWPTKPASDKDIEEQASTLHVPPFSLRRLVESKF